MSDDVQLTRYADVLARLHSEIAAGKIDDTHALPGLQPLRSRTSADFTLALVDAWAVLAEILGFHSARHHEEACLDLASELRSLIELSRLVGYQPDPGLAASASLAFTIDDAGAAPVVTVPVGTAVTSVPLPGEQPVTFETIQAITARPTWNQLLPKLSRMQTFATSESTVLLAGTATNVSTGDGMLVPIGSSGRAFGIVRSVRVRPDDPPIPGAPARPGWTAVELGFVSNEVTLGGETATELDLWPAGVDPGPLLRDLSPNDATVLDAEELNAAAINGGFATADVFSALQASRAKPQSVLVFRAQANILGGAAPEKDAVATGVKTSPWTDANLDQYPGHGQQGKYQFVFCDAVVKSAHTGPVVLREDGDWTLLTARGVEVRYHTAFTVSGKSTVLNVEATDLSHYSIQGTSVFLAAELLPLAPANVLTHLAKGEPNIVLDDWVDGLSAGHMIAITGRSATHPGLAVAHVTQLKAVRHELSRTGSTAIDLVDPLPDALRRDSVRINANVAPATHGESRSEVLGSAQGQDPQPSFTLSSSPLTYLSDASGSSPALTVYVNGVRRHRVPALLAPDERGYTVHQDDKQSSTIQFGSPLPTGVINVRADYRVGLGAGAAVRAGQLSMLASRPPGVRAVTNPLPARGGADPETVAEARRNAPVSVRALGRAVSLVDYADFARAYPGVAKAAARWIGTGRMRGVQVSVIGPKGADITTDSDVYKGLVAALAASSDELVPVRVVQALRIPVRVAADVHVDPDRITEDVLNAARSAVIAALSFDARDLGQPVWGSEIIEVLQSVPGIVAAYLTGLCRLVNGQPEFGVLQRAYLRPDAPAGSSSTAAVLLTLDPTSLKVKAVGT